MDKIRLSYDYLCALTPCNTLGVLGLDDGASTRESGVINAVVSCTLYTISCDQCDGVIAIDIWGNRHASFVILHCVHCVVRSGRLILLTGNCCCIGVRSYDYLDPPSLHNCPRHILLTLQPWKSERGDKKTTLPYNRATCTDTSLLCLELAIGTFLQPGTSNINPLVWSAW